MSTNREFLLCTHHIPRSKNDNTCCDLLRLSRGGCQCLSVASPFYEKSCPTAGNPPDEKKS